MSEKKLLSAFIEETGYNPSECAIVKTKDMFQDMIFVEHIPTAEKLKIIKDNVRLEDAGENYIELIFSFDFIPQKIVDMIFGDKENEGFDKLLEYVYNVKSGGKEEES